MSLLCWLAGHRWTLEIHDGIEPVNDHRLFVNLYHLEHQRTCLRCGEPNPAMAATPKED